MPPAPVLESATLAVAVNRAADRLGFDDRVLAAIIGVPESAASHMRHGKVTLAPGSAPFDLSALFVRLFTALDAITMGEESVAKAWLSNQNEALGDAPINLIQTATGLTEVVRYLDSRSARL